MTSPATSERMKIATTGESAVLLEIAEELIERNIIQRVIIDRKLSKHTSKIF